MALALRKRNVLIFAAAVALLLTLIPMSAYAQTDATVNATVTPGFVAVSVDPGIVAYGTVNLGSTGVLPAPGTFTATNDGTVSADFAIRGANTDNGWTLSSTVGADQYIHRASNDAFVLQTIVLTTTAATLQLGVAALGTSIVSLNMDVPDSSSSNLEQTAPVTIVATIAP